jgi:hypothetical protein
MSRLSRLKPFDDQSAHLDRFGWVLMLAVVSIIALALVDLTPTSDHLLAMRASGVARKWQLVADLVVGAIVVLLVFFVLADLVTDVPVASVNNSTHPWSLLALASLAPIVIVRRLIHHRTVTTGTLLGAISAFLLIPIAFCYAFLSIDAAQATPFFGQAQPSTSFMYFSLSTLTTVGYGDLTAVTPFARLVSTAEAVSGQVYLVTFVAMLVGLRAQAWAAGRKSDKPGDEAASSAPTP